MFFFHLGLSSLYLSHHYIALCFDFGFSISAFQFVCSFFYSFLVLVLGDLVCLFVCLCLCGCVCVDQDLILVKVFVMLCFLILFSYSCSPVFSIGNVLILLCLRPVFVCVRV